MTRFLDSNHSHHVYMNLPNQPYVYKIARHDNTLEEGIGIAIGKKLNFPKEIIKPFDPRGMTTYMHPVYAHVMQWAHESISDHNIYECEYVPCAQTISGFIMCESIMPIRKINIMSDIKTIMRYGFGCLFKIYDNKDYLRWTLDWWNRKQATFAADEMVEITTKIATREFKSSYSGERHKIVCPIGYMNMAACLMAQAALKLQKSDSMSNIEWARYMVAESIGNTIIAADQMEKNFDYIKLLEDAFAIVDGRNPANEEDGLPINSI